MCSFSAFSGQIFCDRNFGASLESIRYTYHMEFSCKTNISHVSFRLTRQNMCVSLRSNTHTNYFAFLIDISNIMGLTGVSSSAASQKGMVFSSLAASLFSTPSSINGLALQVTSIN